MIGHFYLDIHPRAGNYAHAAISHLLKKTDEQGSVACMLANLPEPSGDAPALLRHDDFVTFFHEFGHIMHDICAEGAGNMTRLAKCPRDFVEAPSQMLENWCWEPQVLAKLSRHHQTKEAMPAHLVGKLCASRYVNVALCTLRQVYLAMMDMSLHTDPPATLEELQALPDRLRPEVSLITNPPGWSMLRNFGHLMNQYSAAYHGYLWSEVLSADMYETRFHAEGVDNPRTGMDYRKMVLAPGGVGSIKEHLEKFLGRPPDNTHFLRSRGLMKKGS